MDRNKKIALLNELGYRVVEIESKLFIFTDWIPAQASIYKHTLIGREVSHLLEEGNTVFFNLSYNRNSAITLMEDELAKQTLLFMEFSPEYKWRTYLPRK